MKITIADLGELVQHVGKFVPHNVLLLFHHPLRLKQQRSAQTSVLLFVALADGFGVHLDRPGGTLGTTEELPPD